jgi:hypothetical protein
MEHDPDICVYRQIDSRIDIALGPIEDTKMSRAKTILTLTRSLFPSWNFFDSLTTEVDLRVRAHSATTGWSNWQPSPPPPPRGLRQFFIFPEGNSWHRESALVQTLAEELQTHNQITPTQDLEASLNFQLVQILAQKRARVFCPEASQCQFAVLVRENHHPHTAWTTLFESSPLALEAHK